MPQGYEAKQSFYSGIEFDLIPYKSQQRRQLLMSKQWHPFLAGIIRLSPNCSSPHRGSMHQLAQSPRHLDLRAKRAVVDS